MDDVTVQTVTADVLCYIYCFQQDVQFLANATGLKHLMCKDKI